ncbi:MAG: hypothetical protein AB1796_07900 [Bacillota bacterium]
MKTGQSLLLAALHQAIKPGSKRAFAGWAKQTTLPQLAGFDPKKLDSQHFWDQMDTVTEQELNTVEKEITLKLKDNGLLSPKLLFYDLTNFELTSLKDDRFRYGDLYQAKISLMSCTNAKSRNYNSS